MSSEVRHRSLKPAALWQQLVDVIVPARCLVCGTTVQTGASLCHGCWPNLKMIAAPMCPLLGIPFEYDGGAALLSPEALSHPPPWNAARAAVIFDETSKTIIHALKYGDRPEAGQFMAKQMARAGTELLEEADLLIPVPLHRFKLWRRRFNQAALLSQLLARQCGKPWEPRVLRKIKAGHSQVGLNAKQRRQNLAGSFAVSEKFSPLIQHKHVLLIDDVRTTGATASACTDTLKGAGAASVSVLTFALVHKARDPHIITDHESHHHLQL